MIAQAIAISRAHDGGQWCYQRSVISLRYTHFQSFARADIVVFQSKNHRIECRAAGVALTYFNDTAFEGLCRGEAEPDRKLLSCLKVSCQMSRDTDFGFRN